MDKGSVFFVEDSLTLNYFTKKKCSDILIDD